MELSKEQIQQIDSYIKSCGVKWYDVRVELVDHFANNLEKELEINPKLDFKQALIDEHKRFGDKGFKSLLTIKTNEVEKKFFKDSIKHLVSFFKIPKIILSVISFWGLSKLIHFFDNKEVFFQILTGLLLIIMTQLLVRVLISNQKKGKKFLTLNRGNNFLQLTNFLAISFNSISIFRNDSSYENQMHNYLQIFIFVVFILYYISGEYVYDKLIKNIRENYPEIKIAY